VKHANACWAGLNPHIGAYGAFVNCPFWRTAGRNPTSARGAHRGGNLLIGLIRLGRRAEAIGRAERHMVGRYIGLKRAATIKLRVAAREAELTSPSTATPSS